MKCRGLVLFFLLGAVCVHTFSVLLLSLFLKSDNISFSHSPSFSYSNCRCCCWKERSCYDPASMEREHIVDKLSPLLPQPLFFFLFPIVSLSSSPKKCTLQTSHTTLFSLSFFFSHFFSSCSVCLLFFLFPLLS